MRRVIASPPRKLSLTTVGNSPEAKSRSIITIDVLLRLLTSCGRMADWHGATTSPSTPRARRLAMARFSSTGSSCEATVSSSRLRARQRLSSAAIRRAKKAFDRSGTTKPTVSLRLSLRLRAA